MGEQCDSWEEEMFWTRFQSTHFVLFLRGAFRQQIALPEKFAKHYKQKLLSTVTLKGPSGGTWEVGLTTVDEALFFKQGWPEFLNDHSLKQNDFIVFKFDGVSSFDVLMFEGQNLCEKASSYFVRKCSHSGAANSGQTKRKLEEEDPAEVIHLNGGCGLDGTPKKTIYNDTPPVSVKRSGSSKPKKNVHRGVCYIRPVRTSLHSAVNNIPFPGDVDVNAEMMSSQPPGMSLLEEQQKKVIALGQSVISENGFLVVLRRSHVRTKFFMTIPTGWLLRNLILKSQDVVLRMNNHTWNAKFCFYRSVDRYRKTGGRSYGGLSAGWKTFVAENNLEENDVCVFEPEDPAAKPIVFDVSIFHVQQVPVAAPLTDMASTSC